MKSTDKTNSCFVTEHEHDIVKRLQDRVEVLEKTVERLEKENTQLSKMLSAMNHYRVQDFS